MIYLKKDLENDIKNLNLASNTKIMVHSSFSSIKNIEGGAKTVLEVFKNQFKDGVLLLPTHTWASIQNDFDTLDLSKPNSCVGYLTNEAILDKDFKRSVHPTHSVCAYGKLRDEYIKDDVFAKTPCPPFGSFGKLKDHGYILFIGCPLSKNTFIHSIEEEMNIENRFTEHIYTFYVKDNDKTYEFHMPRHFNKECPHISDNYEKLLPFLLDKKIAKKVKILDSTSYLIDAFKLHEFVIELLNKDKHIFDTNKKIVLD